LGKNSLTNLSCLKGCLENLAERGDRVLYVSGEESAGQIKIRAERVGGKVYEYT